MFFFQSSSAYPFNPLDIRFHESVQTVLFSFFLLSHEPSTDTSTLLAAALFATATARPHNYFLILNRRKEAGKPKENHCNHIIIIIEREERENNFFIINIINLLPPPGCVLNDKRLLCLLCCVDYRCCGCWVLMDADGVLLFASPSTLSNPLCSPPDFSWTS